MKALINRIAREPVLITALIVAVGNLFAKDWSGSSAIIEGLVVIVAGFIARQFVSPVPTIDPLIEVEV